MKVTPLSAMSCPPRFEARQVIGTVAHYRQRDYWRSIEHPQIGRAIPYPRGPFACDALRIEPRGRAPNLGEHTQHVLAHDLGMSADAIMALRTSGVVR